ncbi:hypothetical protein C8446_22610 [Salmonella enterica]|nr:hypothetical protein [Salmonella enterica]
MGFFKVQDVPARRVVQYSRVSGNGENVVYIEDESILGVAVDAMPYVDKTGLAVTSGYFGMVYEVPYLEDAGDVYFATQPEDSEAGATLTAAAKAGTRPYSYQWYKDDKQVVNVPDGGASLKASEPGKYWVVVTDAAGGSAVSRAAEVK